MTNTTGSWVAFVDDNGLLSSSSKDTDVVVLLFEIEGNGPTKLSVNRQLYCKTPLNFFLLGYTEVWIETEHLLHPRCPGGRQHCILKSEVIMEHEYVTGAAGIANFYGRLKRKRKNFHGTHVAYQA